MRTERKSIITNIVLAIITSILGILTTFALWCFVNIVCGWSATPFLVSTIILVILSFALQESGVMAVANHMDELAKLEETNYVIDDTVVVRDRNGDYLVYTLADAV